MTPLHYLADTPVEHFMRNDWHVRPRLFRQALPNFTPLCSIDTLQEMASDEHIESRLVQNLGNATDPNWQLEHGPFETLPPLSAPQWTVLLQGVDQHLPEAYDLLQQFRFIPDARLDDIMISLASDQGGVGPHLDSYDVFLLQMHGQRLWNIGPVPNPSAPGWLENCPLKILQTFSPTEQHLLQPGDMLYLPPGYGHEGIAQGAPCTTISIGFRAPSAAEVLSNLLHDLAETVGQDPALKQLLFTDPQRGICQNPGELPDDLLQFAQTLWQNHQPSANDHLRSLGRFLTEPKPNVSFERNSEALSAEEICTILGERGIALGMATKALFKGKTGFINGESITIEDENSLKALQSLFNARELSPKDSFCALKHTEFRFFLVGFAKAGWIGTQI